MKRGIIGQRCLTAVEGKIRIAEKSPKKKLHKSPKSFFKYKKA